jgi:thiamine kinase-like enzyme
MSDLLSPREALAQIPGWDADYASVRELKGGLTNRVYLVLRNDGAYVLRLDAAHTDAFNLDRVSEVATLKRAAAAGLAPEVIYTDVESGILLNRYVSGRTWEVTDLDDDANIELLVDLLRKVHELPASGEKFDPHAVAWRYTRNLEGRHGLHAFALRCKQVIANMPRSGEFVCCHNDVIAENIIGDTTLKLVDWEYACDNDPLFDLASLIGFHNLADERRALLLNAYAGGNDPELTERLDVQVRLYDAIQWLWLANRHIITRTNAQAARLEELRQRID